MADQETALIVGAGPGLSASLARLFAAQGMKVALTARDTGKLADLAGEIDAVTVACDVGDAESIESMWAAVKAEIGVPDVVVYNPSYRVRGPFIELDQDEVKKAILITCYSGFLVAQTAAKDMVERGSGSIQFTGASASIKGYPQSASFAMGKFGLRGLAQSMARELAPQNIHIAHFVIDGGISSPRNASRAEGKPADSLLEPDAIAQSYLDTHRQHRSAWTWEVELRPWVEKF
ncbi:MAG: SDR family NAD(P)-dependent oxidoreductase [Rhodospirillaceae bacterium]|jgi:NAD(P)-dependent dehydrogenase (short-subunit alcohol dehydrogenase family)|nr:SDR family NAD(P)-dependent oxidoreductase [Rhodospirillaceae bacterium]MBT4703824.1 SDR family NAD(P)-dependent oxidoreductase [Rhodospirillaceae bacterium]MBT5034565.1 SDR family NAD(P)-dependent oxidoreductase [Rhodospirillaceae bacterium]MBT6221204.1 SDR family NAD(P)-dependent oxidoreductase [Rhodospirillaceae bacterium]MBT7770857.1 SDR family NAD(P)-dependent oxidoreductase [Rhodospirillales bacterium]